MPRRKATPPTEMRQDLAEDLAALTETNPDLFPDLADAALGDSTPEDSTPEDSATDTEPDFVITSDPEPEQAPPEPEDPATAARARLGVHALQKAVADQIYTAMKDNNTEVLQVLLTIWRATGAKSFEVKVPTVDGTEEKIAQIALSVGEDKIVVSNENELLDWLEENRPDLTEQIEHPATDPVPARPAWTETRAAPTAVAVLARECRVSEGQVITPDGEIVDGLKYLPAPEPDTFRVTWGGPGSPLKRKAIDLLTHDAIQGASLAGLIPLPEIER